MARFEKDYRHLCRQINSLSNGQARVNVENIFNCSNLLSDVSNFDKSSSVQSFYIEITPYDGPYAHGSFVFRIDVPTVNEYPHSQPIVSCLTRIYHPNIDTAYGNCYNNVCLSTLSDWDGVVNSTLEDLLQGLMFLFYSPNIDDPLTSNISSNEKEFLSKVRIAIEGGLIDDFEFNNPFEMNYGYKKYLMEKENQQMEQEEQLNHNLVDILTEESNYKQLFTDDTLEILMDTSSPLIIHSTPHNKEISTNI